MDWNTLQLVLAVSRAESLSAAARRLNVDQTTVSRRLKAIETDLGTALFSRVEGRLVPTEPGEKVIAAAEAMETAVDDLAENLTGGLQHCEGRVRLTAVPILTNRLLIPQLGDLFAKHPRLEIETIAESSNLSLSRRETDLALRFARPQKDAGLCRKLTDLFYSSYRAEDADDQPVPWITYDETHAHLPQARWIRQQGKDEKMSQLSVSDAESALAAVRAGAGQTLLPDIVAANDASLQCLQPAVISREVWLLVHSDVRQLPRIQAVIDWIDGIFSEGSFSPAS